MSSLLLQGPRCIKLIHNNFNKLDLACFAERLIVEELRKGLFGMDSVRRREFLIGIAENAEQSRPLPIGNVVVFPETT